MLSIDHTRNMFSNCLNVLLTQAQQSIEMTIAIYRETFEELLHSLLLELNIEP